MGLIICYTNNTLGQNINRHVGVSPLAHTTKSILRTDSHTCFVLSQVSHNVTISCATCEYNKTDSHMPTWKPHHQIGANHSGQLDAQLYAISVERLALKIVVDDDD